MCIDKGSKSVISYLHHFLETRGRGETHLDLHCDNCSGQNKNRYMLAYLCWRVKTGKNKEITLHFMVAGHTKFTPDRCFGLLKRRFREVPVNCLDDLFKLVESSSACGINIPELVGTENGVRHVPVFDWQAFLADFRSLPGIKKAHHFRFTSVSPGVCFFRTSVDAEEVSFNLYGGKQITRQAMPQEIPPPGLSAERRQYLASNIRDFILADDFVKNLVCPIL